MYKIGSRILMINGIVFIIIGLYAVFCNNTFLFSVINHMMDPNFWGKNEVLSKGTLNFKIFTWDFLGMLHIMWGICIFYIAKYGLIKKKEAWAWRCIFASVMAWLLIDVYFSITVKRNSFLLVTVFLAALFIIPLIMSKDALRAHEEHS